MEGKKFFFEDKIKAHYEKRKVPYFEGEFWTAKQKQASSLHEVPYRACFKAEIPRYFINELSKEREVIYDPFAGRGTTGIEAALLKRNVVLNDINPLSIILAKPRFFIPDLSRLEERLNWIFSPKNLIKEKAKTSLPMFFHEKTERELLKLRTLFKKN